MLGLDQLQNFVTAIETIDTLPALHQAFGTAIEPQGLDKHCCVPILGLMDSVHDATSLLDFSEEWTDHYKSPEQLLKNSVFKRALKKGRPFLWKYNSQSGKGGFQVFADAKEFGPCDGMSVPINLVDHYPHVVNMAGENLDIVPGSYHVLHLMAEYYLIRFVALDRAVNGLYHPPNLTPRELECLNWLVKGKSDYEISLLLPVSVRTVNTHIENIRKKFGVTTRTQAVALAVHCGLTRP